MAVATERKTAEERRQAVLDAAMVEFADKGLDGASTDAIARRAGISQPYLFRLFGTKKELFIASVERCFAETLEMFRTMAEGKRGEEALAAIGKAFFETIPDVPTERIQPFFAQGMLLNVMTSMSLFDSDAPWAVRLTDACRRKA